MTESLVERPSAWRSSMAELPMLCDFLPMKIEVSVLVYPGFELLDATGPVSVFNTANYLLSQRGKSPAYGVSMVSPAGGIVRSSSGVGIDTHPLSKLPPRELHTFLIAGAEAGPLAKALQEPLIREYAPRWAESSTRFGSICAGTFVLAALQLIDGRRVASHWSACRPLAAAYPNVQVDENAIFVEDGNVWTSAGVSTGIDMALAMVANDLGPALANDVAKRMVLYVRRPGDHSQFSPLLRAQRRAENPFGDLMNWVHLHLDKKLDVRTLAAKAGVSQRTFFRKFTQAMGETPAHLIESLRLDAARVLISQGLPINVAAARVGLPSVRFARAFERRFGVSPRLYLQSKSSSMSQKSAEWPTPAAVSRARRSR